MADVITRFKLETTQYDSKLRDAAKGLSDYARVAAFAGNEFDKFTKDQAEAARALGSISTSANNAKDKVRELVNAYNQAANAYNALTKEQQQSDWGRALAESINTLKGRITEAKQELYSMGDSSKQTGGFMESLAQKITVNIDAMKLFNAGLTVAKAALDVAKDAFFASEANVDEWGRTMASAEALYSGFVTALNTSDFSSFLTQIDGIVQAARKAYDELDKLGTMRTIQAPGFAKQEAENQRLRLMIMTGKFIEAGDGRKSPLGLKNGDILSPEQIRTLERQLHNGMNKIVSLTKNELGQTGKAIDAYYNSLAKQNGMTMQEFREGTSSWASFSEKMAGYEAYKKWDREARTEFARQGGRGYVDFDKNNPYVEFRKWGTFRVDKMGQNSYNDLVGLIKQQQQQQQQMYSTLGQTYRTINRAEGFTVRGLLNGGGKGGAGGGNNDVSYIAGSIGAYEQRIAELKKDQKDVTSTAEWDDLQQKIGELVIKVKELKGELKVEPYDFTKDAQKMGADFDKEMRDKLSNPDKLIGPGLSKIVKEIAQPAKKEANLTQEFGKMAGGIQSIVGGIENLGIEIPDGMKQMLNGMQGLISVVSGIATICAAIQTIQTAQIFKFWSGGGVVHAATGLIVPGNNYSGDMVPSMINSGELILNRAQQGVIASQLENGNGGGMRVVGEIQGEKIVLVANRFLKRSGQGELVTWK